MRLGYSPVDFPNCNFTSAFESLLKCSDAQLSTIEMYHVLIAAGNELIELVPHETIDSLARTISDPRSNIDAWFFSLYMAENRTKFFSYSNPFEDPDRLCFYMHPKMAEEQMLVQDHYWCKPYQSYGWILVIFAILSSFFIHFPHHKKWLSIISDITLPYSLE